MNQIINQLSPVASAIQTVIIPEAFNNSQIWQVPLLHGIKFPVKGGKKNIVQPNSQFQRACRLQIAQQAPQHSNFMSLV
ncbi:hypothetical protein D3C77_366000 [compost metagenome]